MQNQQIRTEAQLKLAKILVRQGKGKLVIIIGEKVTSQQEPITEELEKSGTDTADSRFPADSNPSQ
jgi:hypothetical protein